MLKGKNISTAVTKLSAKHIDVSNFNQRKKSLKMARAMKNKGHH